MHLDANDALASRADGTLNLGWPVPISEAAPRTLPIPGATASANIPGKASRSSATPARLSCMVTPYGCLALSTYSLKWIRKNAPGEMILDKTSAYAVH